MNQTMRTILFFIALAVFPGTGLPAQIRLPEKNNDREGLLGCKHQPGTGKEYQTTGTSLIQWYALPSPSAGPVTQTSIACDGSDMVIFYREPAPSLNIDMGPIKKWQGSYWSDFAGATNQCHSPDVDIEGSVVVATWYTDAYDYGYGSNINGPWVSFTGTMLQNQYYPRAAMAMGFPYMSFTCKYSDGMPSMYDMLHIRSIIGVGDKIELRGGWRVPYLSVGMKTDITGDEHAWYCVYIQQEFLYVDKGAVVDGRSEYTDLGDGFRMYNPVSDPEITLYQGKPVVGWTENGGTEIFVAEWSGSEWLLIGSGTISEGTLNTIRMAVTDTDLYLVYTLSDAPANISVNRYDGSEWYELPAVQDQPAAGVSTADIAIYNGAPVVAYTENNQLNVKIYADQALSGPVDRIQGHPPVRFYPNPFQNNYSIDLGREYDHVRVRIMNSSCQVLVHHEFDVTSVIQGTLIAAPGLYLAEISANGQKIALLKIMHH